jgi:ElaB/YqjD/DUF883 family membrane-anchored ribosome-binding protein
VNTTSGTTKEQAADVVGAAKETAQQHMGEAAGQGRGALRRQVNQRSTEVGQQATSAADALRQTASQIRQEGDPQKARLASVADQGADRLERMGSYLADADADEILGRAEEMARQQPWLIAGAGLLVGIAAARFMKASSQERYYQRPGAYHAGSVYAQQSVRQVDALPAVELESRIPEHQLGEVR